MLGSEHISGHLSEEILGQKSTQQKHPHGHSALIESILSMFSQSWEAGSIFFLTIKLMPSTSIVHPSPWFGTAHLELISPSGFHAPPLHLITNMEMTNTAHWFHLPEYSFLPPFNNKLLKKVAGVFYFHLLLINSLINSSKLLATPTTLLQMLSSQDPDGWDGGRVEGRSMREGCVCMV